MLVNPWHAALLLDGLLTLGVALHFAAAPFLAAFAAQWVLTPSGYDTTFFPVLGLGASAFVAAVCHNPEAAPPKRWFRTGPLLLFAPFVLWLARLNAPAAIFWHLINAAAFMGTPRGHTFTLLRSGAVWTLAVLLYSQRPESNVDVSWIFLGHAATFTAFAHLLFTAPSASSQ